MKIVGYILAACILLAVLRAFMIAAVAIGAIALIWGVYFRTRETFGLLLMILLYGIAGSHPLACIMVTGVVILVVKLGRRPGSDGTRRAPP